jgi:hypothetical protein
VAVSHTLDDDLKRVLSLAPAAPVTCGSSTAHGRGVPVTVLLPGHPALNDHELEALVGAAADAGASNAAFMLLRLPHELGALFEQWLREHYPQRADRVLNLLRELRGGRLNDPRFGHRMRGEGPYAALLAARFAAACRRSGLGNGRGPQLDCSRSGAAGPRSNRTRLLESLIAQLVLAYSSASGTDAAAALRQRATLDRAAVRWGSPRSRCWRPAA